jgi:hypothetical protein
MEEEHFPEHARMPESGSHEQALLPEAYESPSIDSMLEGDTFFTVPWAMWVDRERRCWLHPGYIIHEEPGGTVEMLVTRTADGFVVDISGVEDHKWGLEEEPGYMSPEDTEYIPVVRLIT